MGSSMMMIQSKDLLDLRPERAGSDGPWYVPRTT